MTIVLVFLAVLGVMAGWWLARQGLMTKPWMEEGAAGPAAAVASSHRPAAKVGLCIFLVVASSLFTLLISAWSMRMQGADWWSVPVPRLLWVNTGVLVLSSFALEWAKSAAHQSDMDQTRAGLFAGAGLALVFLAGQILAWRQLYDGGYFLAANPANSFFYVITGLHGLHMLGGLVALGRTIAKARRATLTEPIRLSVELCATYWHFLLFVWLILFALLNGWAADFLALCRQLLT